MSACKKLGKKRCRESNECVYYCDGPAKSKCMGTDEALSAIGQKIWSRVSSSRHSYDSRNWGDSESDYDSPPPAKSRRSRKRPEPPPPPPPPKKKSHKKYRPSPPPPKKESKKRKAPPQEEEEPRRSHKKTKKSHQKREKPKDPFPVSPYNFDPEGWYCANPYNLYSYTPQETVRSCKRGVAPVKGHQYNSPLGRKQCTDHCHFSEKVD
jgi:hypothetical protein